MNVLYERIIDGKLCTCEDIGCDNYMKALWNRFRVKYKLNTTGYREVENALEGTPLGKPIPDWIPQGNLPVVGKKEWLRHESVDSGD